MTFSKNAIDIRNADTKAFVRRMMWEPLDERIREVFLTHHKQHDIAELYGKLFYFRSRDCDPIMSTNLPSYAYINATHIQTGLRELGVYLSDGDKLTMAYERNCQIWYAQSPSGTVKVFVAPFDSNAGTIRETEIIIGNYRNPTSITVRDIQKHFNIFFKYCACTSHLNASNWKNYIFRQYLIYNDFRYKSSFNSKLVMTIERIITLALGGVAVWASLYAGGKI